MSQENNLVEVELDDISTGSSSIADFGDTNSADEENERNMDLINIKEDDGSSDEEPLPGDSDDPTFFPSTYLVVSLHPKIKADAISWLVHKIKATKKSGGAELLVRCEPFSTIPKEDKKIVLHISASNLRLLEVAEYLEFKKLDGHGFLREFQVRDLDSFLQFGEILLHDLLSPAEKELIVMHELQNLRALPGELNVPGYPHFILHSGQSIFQKYIVENLILYHFPLHDENHLQSLLKANWLSAFWSEEPFEELRRYFGESITLYFSFCCWFTLCGLIPPATIVLLMSLLPEMLLSQSTMIFLVCVINLIWVTILLKYWRRKCSELAYTWGTLQPSKWQEPRLGYTGRMGFDPVTGAYQPRYPWWKTGVKVYCVSLPLVFVCMYVAFMVMILYFRLEDYLQPYKIQFRGRLLGYLLQCLASVIYACSVAVMTIHYRKFATWLTEWENHRTQSQYDKHRVAKLVAFEFVNNFMSFMYIAFFLQDLKMLKNQLLVMLLVMHLIVAFQEAIIPLFIRKTSQKMEEFLGRNNSTGIKFLLHTNRRPVEPSPSAMVRSTWLPMHFGLEPLSPDDPRIEMRRLEGSMVPYKGSFDDYLQLFIQFGYVFLFSPVFPFAAAIAALVNVFLIWANIFKLCEVFQRPIPKRAKDIGTWQVAFELMGVLSVMTNCALVALTSNWRSYKFEGWTDAQFYFLMVVYEHLIVGLKVAVVGVIPNIPYWVKIAMAKTEYQAKMALKREQQAKSRRRLTLRFQAINWQFPNRDTNDSESRLSSVNPSRRRMANNPH